MATFPSAPEAQELSSLTNRIFPKDKSQTENRPANRTHPYGGTLVWGVANKPTLINPVFTSDSVSMTLLDLIFNRLIRINSKGIIEPDLAEEWAVSDDGLAYTFHLRKNVLFHDGIECTAEDVLFTYQQITDPKNNSPFRSHFELVDHFKVIDQYTFEITLRELFPSFLYKLVREIIPKHILEGKDLYNAPFNEHPIGTGPFEFKSWNKETNQIELDFNPQYLEGRPYLDRIIVKTYDNVSQSWSAFMRREIDLIQWIKSKDYLVLKDDPLFQAHAVQGAMYYAIAYNLNDPILRDREVRLAIAHGLNRQAIINALPGFSGKECLGPFHPDSAGYNHDIKPIEYNPVKAKMMLMHRGWQDSDGDGILEKDRRELKIKLLVDESRNYLDKMSQLIRQQLAEIGIKVIIQLIDEEHDINKEFLKNSASQAWLRLFQGLGLDPYEAVGSWYSSSSEFGKFGDYKSEKIDHFFELARITQDQNERTEIYNKIHNIIYDDQPACFLFFPTGYFAINADFKNTDEYFSIFMPTYSMKDWYVAEN